MIPEISIAFARRVVRHIQVDPRFVALLARGSWPLKGALDQPDLELLLMLHPDASLAAPYEHHAMASRFGRVLATFAGAHDSEPNLLACLFEPPLLRVDLRFKQLPDTGIVSEDTVLLWSRVDRLPHVLTLHVPSRSRLDLCVETTKES